MNRVADFASWWFTHFAGTVTLARLTKQLQGELGRRAEYACRFGITAPSQWDPRPFLLPLVIALCLMTIFCLA